MLYRKINSSSEGKDKMLHLFLKPGNRELISGKDEKKNEERTLDISYFSKTKQKLRN